MTHKNAQQLLGEVKELLKEAEVYALQHDSLLRDLKKLDADYQGGRFGYLEYEEKQKSLLRGRTKEEWAAYYRACRYSLLKRAGFIVSQVFAIVSDDDSASRLRIAASALSAKPVVMPAPQKAYQKAAAKPAAISPPVVPQKELKSAPVHDFGKGRAFRGQLSQPGQVQSRIEVFNVDNEVARLREQLASRHVSLEQLEEVAAEISAGKARPESGLDGDVAKKKDRLKASVPGLGELEEEVEAAERKALKKRAEAAAQAEKERKKQAAWVVLAAEKPAHKHGGIVSLIAGEAARAFRPVVVFAAGLPAAAVRTAGLAGLAVKNRIGALARQKPKKHAAFGDSAVSIEGKVASPVAKPASSFAQQRQGVFSALKQLAIPRKAKGVFVEEIIAMEKGSKSEEKPLNIHQGGSASLALGWFSPKGLLSELTERFRSKQEPIVGMETTVPAHMRKLKELRKRVYEEEKLSGFDTTLLAQEARRVKKILEVEKPEVYQGSSIGLLANLTVRKASLFLVENFPEFFGFLYNALRAANVKVLSNTYVNIMILLTLFVSAVSFFILVPLFFVLGYPIYQIVLRAAIFSVLAGFSCATIFYAYPFMKIKERRRNIMTNLPFAVNHMAAVATSGVSPAAMFELIAGSKEYNEIGIEVKKIVDFINIFGYDLLTAIRTVAATTPSQHFKEFLEGIVSTIETGGDLDTYLKQEAEQAALTYNLERQRYNESVSTYSDIYTGLLIAAPLFFVAAMALVNMLGGSLGGIGVDVVMAVGAYVIIPLLNIGFLLFLQVTQPDV